ncbi:hypothetical protein AYI68_g3027 [Smittium mucronatum]|uniref:Uncharacterized protein n=1 Tax=Smittium mucronatum TaxID=133383 RepID=A0A1R0H127_9FUNG|nr:hypothetical protein AYI68_g3027 [Smittium mucronatum]
MVALVRPRKKSRVGEVIIPQEYANIAICIDKVPGRNEEPAWYIPAPKQIKMKSAFRDQKEGSEKARSSYRLHRNLE